ncbi:hypothetical protein HHK36_004741 [Tetracentron sinense]|uniref:DUF4371 domain-containing protein n=1 Tax=Tetracentron sinense TaxID=13715 RepID=A0A835DLN1_TETSI|nr:hypothetical protein HHK36_004741 [Tetracentron sinense]
MRTREEVGLKGLAGECQTHADWRSSFITANRLPPTADTQSEGLNVSVRMAEELFVTNKESADSNDKGNSIELLQFLADHNESIKNVVLEHASKNLKLIAPDIQKDILSAAVNETINTIINEVGDSLFAVLIDESRDVSIKEQMVVVLRYVDKRRSVTEHFLGIVHITETTVVSLKVAIDELFTKNGLSITRLRGQGHDGASNMQGEFNSLKTLIMKGNEYAFYVHCFAHQL